MLNGEMSSVLPLSSGVRQRRVVLLLFYVVLEVLENAVKQARKVKMHLG